MINKSKIINEINSGWGNIDIDGESHLTTFITIIVNAVIDEITTNGEVLVDSIGGGCTASGVHPPVHSKGKIL